MCTISFRDFPHKLNRIKHKPLGLSKKNTTCSPRLSLWPSLYTFCGRTAAPSPLYEKRELARERIFPSFYYDYGSLHFFFLHTPGAGAFRFLTTWPIGGACVIHLAAMGVDTNHFDLFYIFSSLVG